MSKRTPEFYADLMAFCDHHGIDISPTARALLELKAQGLNWASTAKKLDRDQGNLHQYLRRVEARAARQGYAPEFDMTRPAPAGFSIRGTSTLYDELGRPRVQWVKTDRNRKAQEEAIEAFVDGLTSRITPAKRSKRPSRKGMRTDIMPAIFIGDAHIGMRAFGQETKHHDFDTKIATNQLKEAFHYLTERAEPSEKALFVNVGDLIHANAQSNTTVAGTPVDVDTRHHSTMRSAAEAMVYGINLQLEKHQEVCVVMARGNHDSDAASAIQLVLEFYYKHEPRVKVLPAHGFVHYIEWGKWLLGIHHGDKMKAEKLVTVMSRDMPEAWGRTTHRLWATGHYHKEAVKTFDGVKHKVFAALPPPDSWHASHGFAGDGEMEMLTFQKDGGIASSIVYNVPQPRAEPDARIG